MTTMSPLSRRALIKGVGVGIAAMAGTAATASPAHAWEWATEFRYCVRCAGLTQRLLDWVCPAGGNHDLSLGWTFRLPVGGYSMPYQDNWRVCIGCHNLYWEGNNDPDGKCAGRNGSEHLGGDRNYCVPANVGEPPWHQNRWAYCGGCFGMFYDGYDGIAGRPYFKGVCPAGGTHWKIGWDFAIPIVRYS